MNERLNFSKTAVIFMPLALLFGGLTMSIINEIISNGLLFTVPYLVYFLLGIGVLRIETLARNPIESAEASVFLRTFLSFDSITSLFIISFFTFFEVFFLIEFVKFSFDYLFKIRNPEFQFSSLTSHFIIYLSFLVWGLLLYMKLFVEHSRLGWLKVIRFVILILVLGLISLVVYKPDYFLEYINTILTDINSVNRFFLRPQTIWDLKIWQNSAGKSFILIVIGYFLFKWWKSQIITGNSSFKFGIISLIVLFSMLGSILVYFSPRLLSLASDLSYIPDSKLMVGIGISSASLIVFIIVLNTLTSIFFNQINKTKFPLIFNESKYITKKNVLFILILLVGLASGILFTFVGFKDYFYWIGMIFLLLIVLNFTNHFIASFSFNRTSKRFDERNTENKLKGMDKFLLRFVLPFFLIPILFVSLPDYFSNFLGNKQLTKKIEYLQDLGRITSNHHSLEPYIVRDYNKIILDIDSNQVELDKIDSLKPIQKDSIQLYLENRNYKMNENFRIEKLQFHHDVVFVKNFSKWALLIFIITILLFYYFKLRGR